MPALTLPQPHAQPAPVALGAATATEALVVARNLTKAYGAVKSLTDVSLTINGGEVYGLLGPNGSGKTTFIRLLMGFLQPTAGSASIGGLDCHRDRVAVHRLVSYMPGEARLFPTMRGHDVLRFFAEVHPGGDLERSRRFADRLQMDLGRRVLFCSSGMRQKLALIAALAPHTRLAILDEPTSNLDPTARSEVLALAREAADEGRTVLFSSHVMSEIEQVCDRACILRRGQLVHTQVIADLRRQHRIRAQLEGSMPTVPTALTEGLTIRQEKGEVVIQTLGELRSLLAWLTTLPIREIRVEPIGLQAVYDRFHRGEDAE